MIDAAIQGVPEQAQHRRATITEHFVRKKKEPRKNVNRSISNEGGLCSEAVEDSLSPMSPYLPGGGLGGAVGNADYQ